MAETVDEPPPPAPESPDNGGTARSKKREAAITAALITGGCALVAAFLVSGPNWLSRSTGTVDQGTSNGTGVTSGQTDTGGGQSTGGASSSTLFTEISDNGAGTRVFSNPEGAPVASGVRTRIPMRAEVQVRCVVMESNMQSVTGMYLIVGGEWDGLYAVADTFANGDKVGDSSGSTAVDPRVPAC